MTMMGRSRVDEWNGIHAYTEPRVVSPWASAGEGYYVGTFHFENDAKTPGLFARRPVHQVRARPEDRRMPVTELTAV
jgi:hypothetical protein